MRVRPAATAARFRWAGAAVLRPPEALPNLAGVVAARRRPWAGEGFRGRGAAWPAGGCRPRVEAGPLLRVAYPHPSAAGLRRLQAEGLRLRLAAASGRQER